MSFKRSNSIMEEQILLGGKISFVHPEYKEIAQNTAINQKCVWFLKNWEKLLEKTATEAIIDIMLEFGKIDNFAGFGEITKLSAILGDSRPRKSGKGVRDAINQKLHNL